MQTRGWHANEGTACEQGDRSANEGPGGTLSRKHLFVVFGPAEGIPSAVFSALVRFNRISRPFNSEITSPNVYEWSPQ